MKLEEKLISLRKEKGLSQMKLAEMMNVSRQAISRWEVGAAVPSTDNLKFLGNLYGVSLEYLLHDDAPKPNQNETPMQKISTFPSVSFQISGPVVARCAAGLAGFSN